MKKIMLVFGTRPEAIKMCPVVKELEKRPGIRTVVCVTGQHREMLQQALDVFGVQPDYNLNIMKAGQTLFDITTEILEKIRNVLLEVRPDVVLVHGDTSTTFVTALACYYLQIPVGHVEAGLRTYNIYSPYPEEFNREAVSIISRYNFAPTETARENLLREGRDPKTIWVTGNTAIDALKTTVRPDYTDENLEWAAGKRLILITAHRRENLGEPMHHMFRAIRRVLEEHPDTVAIYPVHKNPAVRKAAEDIFGEGIFKEGVPESAGSAENGKTAGGGTPAEGTESSVKSHSEGAEISVESSAEGTEVKPLASLRLIEPLDVLDFHNYMNHSYLILTDSGGIQEEAPALGKPVLVMRNTTERPEGIRAGTCRLVGTDEETIYREFTRLLDDPEAYEAMAHAANPYGDGHASERIADVLLKKTPAAIIS